MRTSVMIRMEDAGSLQRALFKLFMDVATRGGPPRMAGKACTSVCRGGRGAAWLGGMDRPTSTSSVVGLA